MKAREVRDHFLGLAPWIDPEDTVDRIVAGDPEKEVRSCLVTWISSLEACREAARRGADLLITHEPTFYVHWDRPEGRDEELSRPKRRLLEEAGLVVLRIHDVWDTLPEVGVPWAWARFLGFAGPPAATVQYEPPPAPVPGRPPRPPYMHRYDIAPVAAGALARRLAARTALLGEPVLQFVGDEAKVVSRIGVGTGCACSPREFLAAGCDCSVVCDDGTAYWRGLQLAEDWGHPVIRVNHGTSEEPAMATLAEHINRCLPGVSAEHLPHRPSYRTVGAAVMPERVTRPGDLKPGDFYEDCAFHPCLCIEVNTGGGDMAISGISLVDGSSPRGCSVPGCDVRRLTLEEALVRKFFGPVDSVMPRDKMWHLDGSPTWVTPIWIRDACMRMKGRG